MPSARAEGMRSGDKPTTRPPCEALGCNNNGGRFLAVADVKFSNFSDMVTDVSRQFPLPKAEQRRDAKFHDQRAHHGGVGNSDGRERQQTPQTSDEYDESQEPEALTIFFNSWNSTPKSETYREQKPGQIPKMTIRNCSNRGPNKSRT